MQSDIFLPHEHRESLDLALTISIRFLRTLKTEDAGEAGIQLLDHAIGDMTALARFIQRQDDLRKLIVDSSDLDLTKELDCE